jgi:phage tail-like protein
MSQSQAEHTARTSELLQYLPAIYQEGPWGGEAPPSAFLPLFLLAFERILFGARTLEGDLSAVQPDSLPPGLEAEIANLHEVFDPAKTPSRFLEWLASWAALTLRADLAESRKRALIARIIPLYRIRGTKRYLEELLKLYLDAQAAIAEPDGEFRIGVQSTVGVDTYIGGGPPYFFRVTLSSPAGQQPDMERQFEFARGVIELAKPAHTAYELLAIHAGLQVAVHSTVGVDTFLISD